MAITVSELSQNFVKYLSILNDEKLYITDNGRVIAVLSKPDFDINTSKIDIAMSLFGVLSDDITLEESKEERLLSV